VREWSPSEAGRGLNRLNLLPAVSANLPPLVLNALWLVIPVVETAVFAWPCAATNRPYRFCGSPSLGHLPPSSRSRSPVILTGIRACSWPAGGGIVSPTEDENGDDQSEPAG
jgi:hypothetical protein